MQKLFGLALLGMVTEHILVFLHGTGANGKGVLTLVLQGLLGDADHGGYAVSAPDGFLMSGRDGKHETEMARLRGTPPGVLRTNLRQTIRRSKSQTTHRRGCAHRPVHARRLLRLHTQPPHLGVVQPPTRSQRRRTLILATPPTSRSCTWCQKTNATQRSTPSS